jgi:hypothetical protein
MKEILKKLSALFQNNKKRLILLLVLVFAVFLVMDYNSRMTSLYRVTGQLSAVQTQEGKMALTVQHLNTQIAYATSEAGVVDWARDENMNQPGDVHVEPLSPQGVTPTPTSIPITTSAPAENWQIWILLFFGG